ncbi:MAG: hypothetical protein K8R54_10980 [Bacteroidales bacterium]|nr:hypothetical protein [Bacteroidales bacterium]
MIIKEVTDKKTIKEFHIVPRIIYKNDQNWIPHIESDIEKKFNQKTNKFFDGTNAKRWILKDDSGNLIGRIATWVHPKYSKKYQQPTGSIGYFECINKQEAADLLFNAAKTCLNDQGMEAMDGPINFGERDQFWGLLIKNFKDPNTYGMNYNPEYYIKLFETYGFEVYYNQLMYYRLMSDPAQEIFVKKSEELRKDPKFECRSIRGVKLEKFAQNFIDVYNDGWGHTRKNFKKIKLPYAIKMLKSIKPVIDPDIIIFAFYDDRPVGMYFNLPELNQIFRHMNGRMNLIGKLKFMWHKQRKTPTTMYGLVFGVAHDFQGKGVEGAMIKFAGEYIVPLNRYNDTVLTWIGDFNPKMLKVCENLGAKQYRSFSTYRYLFDRSIPFERATLDES